MRGAERQMVQHVDCPTRRSSINQFVIRSTLPMSALMVPMGDLVAPNDRESNDSPCARPSNARGPRRAGHRATPKIPAPRRTLARRRHDFDAYRRRGHIDIDEHSGRRNSGCGNRARGNHHAHSNALREPLISHLLDVTSDPDESNLVLKRIALMVG